MSMMTVGYTIPSAQTPSSNSSIVSYRELEPLVKAEWGFRSYQLFSFDARTRIEIFLIEMDSGCVHASEAHKQGVIEYIYMQEGCLLLEIAGTAAAPHTYKNLSDAPARYQATISYQDL